MHQIESRAADGAVVGISAEWLGAGGDANEAV